MPVQQIAVVPVTKETSGRSSGRARDKTKDTEGEKAAGRSKASGSAAGPGPNTGTRPSISPSSSQDISSPLPRLEEDGSDQATPVMPLIPAHNPATDQSGKRQVKRRHRRRRKSSSVCAAACADAEQRPTHAHAHAPSLSSDEDPTQRSRASRSWSHKKARRLRTHTLTHTRADGTELLSVNSDEAANEEEEGGRAKSRQKPSTRSWSSSRGRGGGREGRGLNSEEETNNVVSYKEGGAGDPDLAAPTVAKCDSKRADHTAAETTATAGPVNSNMPLACSDDELDVCRICHCEGDAECALITPCLCDGSLRFVHHACLHQWIKSSDTRCCELCKYAFIMETRLKPLCKWEKLQMSTNERRGIFASVMFHLIAIACVIWPAAVLVERSANEIKDLKQVILRLSLGNMSGLVHWPFWTKLIVVAIGFICGLIFMYIQCKMYLQLWQRLKAFNRIISVQNCPDTVAKNANGNKPLPVAMSNGQTNVPVGRPEVAPV